MFILLSVVNSIRLSLYVYSESIMTSSPARFFAITSTFCIWDVFSGSSKLPSILKCVPYTIYLETFANGVFSTVSSILLFCAKAWINSSDSFSFVMPFIMLYIMLTLRKKWL